MSQDLRGAGAGEPGDDARREALTWQLHATEDNDLVCADPRCDCVGWERVIVSSQDQVLAAQDGRVIDFASVVIQHVRMRANRVRNVVAAARAFDAAERELQAYDGPDLMPVADAMYRARQVLAAAVAALGEAGRRVDT